MLLDCGFSPIYDKIFVWFEELMQDIRHHRCVNIEPIDIVKYSTLTRWKKFNSGQYCGSSIWLWRWGQPTEPALRVLNPGVLGSPNTPYKRKSPLIGSERCDIENYRLVVWMVLYRLRKNVASLQIKLFAPYNPLDSLRSWRWNIEFFRHCIEWVIHLVQQLGSIQEGEWSTREASSLYKVCRRPTSCEQRQLRKKNIKVSARPVVRYMTGITRVARKIGYLYHRIKINLTPIHPGSIAQR